MLRNRERGLGFIEDLSDSDFWRVPAAEAGQIIFAYVDANVSPEINGVKPDSTLTVFDNLRNTLEFDDNDAPRKASVVAGVATSVAGNVFYRVSETGSAHVLGAYELHHAVVSPVDTASETEPNDTPDNADFITGAMMSGEVARAQSDRFVIHVRASERIVAILDADPDNDGLPTPAILSIASGDGTTFLAHSDVISTANLTANNAHAVGPVVAPADGTLTVLVRGLSDDHDLDYRFIVLVNDRVYVDADSDGLDTARDNCPSVANLDQLDRDGDRSGDACDACPDSVLKTEPGECGCDQADIDVNGDGVTDCGLEDAAGALLSSTGVLLMASSLNGAVSAYDARNGRLVDPEFLPNSLTGGVPDSIAFDPERRRVLLLISGNRVRSIDLDSRQATAFAPAGNLGEHFSGARDLAILPDGHVLITSDAGSNPDAIVELDENGAFVRNRVQTGALGLIRPEDLLVLEDELLVTDPAQGHILRFDLETGQPIGVLATVGQSVLRMALAANGNVFATSQSGQHRGVLEISPFGGFLAHSAPADLSFFRAVHELPNGNILISASRGICEISRDGRLIETKDRRFLAPTIEFVLLDRDGDGIGDAIDNCPETTNAGQSDRDGDGAGDACDACPDDGAKRSPDACGCNTVDADSDGDDVADCIDICPGVANADQADSDRDGIGDACEDDVGGENGDQRDSNGDVFGGVFDASSESSAPPDGNACGLCGSGAFPFAGLLVSALLIGRRRRHDRPRP
jgi:hypothetical protein